MIILMQQTMNAFFASYWNLYFKSMNDKKQHGNSL